MEKYKRDFENFSQKGLILKPKPFSGIFQGKSYPASYSMNERELMRKYNPDAEKLMPFHPKGLRCNAGRTFFRIWPNGTITRCVSDKTALGDLSKGIRLHDDARPCCVKICKCFGRQLVEKPGED